MMYLIAHRRSWSPKGTSICLTFSLRATWLTRSCKAPKGHSQPQKTPRPHSSRLTATNDQRINSIGSIKNEDQLKPLISELVKVRILTTDSWASEYQPINTKVYILKPRRSGFSTRGWRASISWNSMMPVSTNNPADSTAIWKALSRHTCTQIGSSTGGSGRSIKASGTLYSALKRLNSVSKGPEARRTSNSSCQGCPGSKPASSRTMKMSRSASEGAPSRARSPRRM